jgi:hypothetical protein
MTARLDRALLTGRVPWTVGGLGTTATVFLLVRPLPHRAPTALLGPVAVTALLEPVVDRGRRPSPDPGPLLPTHLGPTS